MSNKLPKEAEDVLERLKKISNEKYEAPIRARKESNLKIVEILTRLIEDNPELRFHQLLLAADVIVPSIDGKYGYVVSGYQNENHLESVRLLERVEDSVLVGRLKKKDECGAV